MKWKNVKLGDTATFVNGYPFKPSDWGKDGLPIIRIQNLTKSSSVANYYDGKIPEKYFVKNGDILISWSASLGVYEWTQGDAWLNQHIFKVVFDKGEIDKVFFKHLISLKMDEMLRATHGATMKHITKGKFDDILVAIPPLPTQRLIATILEKADNLRRWNKQLIEKYDELIRSVFHEMFGDPVRNEKKFEVKNLDAVCLSIKDGPHVSPKYVLKGIPFLSVNNIIKGFWDLTDVKFVSVEDHMVYKRKCNPERGDLLYTKGGTTGFAKYIDIEFEFSNWVHLALLKLNKKMVNGRFLEAMLNSNYCYEQAQKYTRGIANRDLVLGQMKMIKLFVPPLEIQNKFATIKENIETQKSYAQKALAQSEALFQGLLQESFCPE